MAIKNSHRSVISGSRAAFSIVVRPSASTAGGQEVLGGADARELESDVGAVEPVGERLEIAVAELEGRPIASRPATCMSIGRAPKSSPPGIDRRTCPHRVRRGPSTLIDARIRSTNSYGATGVRSPVSVSSKRSGAGRLISTPIATSRSLMMSTSAIAGTLVISNVPSHSSVVAISLSTEFFAPGTTTCPTAARCRGRR